MHLGTPPRWKAGNVDMSLTLILAGLLSMLFAELYGPWNKPNPYARDDYARFWGFESWRWTAVLMSYVRPIEVGMVAVGVLSGAVRVLVWLIG